MMLITKRSQNNNIIQGIPKPPAFSMSLTWWVPSYDTVSINAASRHTNLRSEGSFCFAAYAARVFCDRYLVRVHVFICVYMEVS